MCFLIFTVATSTSRSHALICTSFVFQGQCIWLIVFSSQTAVMERLRILEEKYRKLLEDYGQLQKEHVYDRERIDQILKEISPLKESVAEKGQKIEEMNTEVNVMVNYVRLNHTYMYKLQSTIAVLMCLINIMLRGNHVA